MILSWVGVVGLRRDRARAALPRSLRATPEREGGAVQALWLSGFWIAISLAFGGLVWFLAGVGGAEAYLAAYLLEKSLSVDNVFVFSVIFTSFAVPESDRYHVLFYGVIGAIVFRAIFVLAGAALLAAFA
jgi:tellurite resistance protein TerC